MGGQPSVPKPPSPQEQAEARIREMEAQRRMDEDARLAQEERDRKQRELDLQQFNQNVDQSYGGALTRGEQMFRDLGIDYGGGRYEQALTSKLDAQRRMVPELDSNPGSYFGDTVIQGVMDQIANQDRRKYTQEFDTFAGQNFANNTFADTYDDAILADILGSQYTSAADAAKRAYDRGTLNDQGYTYALDQLQNQRTAGDATLQSLGGGILSGYRDDLRGIADEGRTSIGNYQLGDNFSTDPYRTRINDTTSRYQQQLEGDIMNAFGGQELFDIGSILGKAGQEQGVSNTQSPLFNAFASEQNNKKNKTRGTGTQGVF